MITLDSPNEGDVNRSIEEASEGTLDYRVKIKVCCSVD